MSQRFFLAMSALPVLLLAGCSSYKTTGQCDFSALEGYIKNPGPVLVSDVPGTVSPQPLNAVSVSDQDILFKIMPRSVTAQRTETGTVQVIASLVNCTDYPQQVQARAQFFDKNNAILRTYYQSHLK